MKKNPILLSKGRHVCKCPIFIKRILNVVLSSHSFAFGAEQLLAQILRPMMLRGADVMINHHNWLISTTEIKMACTNIVRCFCSEACCYYLSWPAVMSYSYFTYLQQKRIKENVALTTWKRALHLQFLSFLCIRIYVLPVPVVQQITYV